MTLRSFFAAFLVLGILPVSAQRKSPPAPVSRDAVAMTPESILLESYQLGRNLIPAERAILLNLLARVAAQHHLQCTRAWAEENFRLAQQLPMDWDRLAIEKNSLVALSYTTSRRSMALLRLMDLPVADDDGSFPEDVRSDSAQIIFSNYWRDSKRRGLPKIREVAVFLGQTGQYPYLAITAIITDLSAGSSRPSGQLPEDARSLLLDAYSSYSRGSKFGVEDAEFVEFLRKVRPILPAPLFRQGLEAAVERLLNGGETNGKTAYLANIYTDKGTATFHRKQEQILFDILPLVREVDPNWANQIVQRDPALAQGGGNSGTVISSEGIFSAGGSEQQSDGLEQSRAHAAGDLAQTNPGEALRLAQTIVNPALRTVALANIASAVGKSTPGQAIEIEKTIGDTMPLINDSEDRLLASAALARTAAAGGDRATFLANVDKCFTLGEELFDEDLIAHPGRPTYDAPAYYVLQEVVQSGASVDPITIASKVHQLRSTPLEAFLLDDLATKLYADQKTPHTKVTTEPKLSKGHVE
jgi:hypothetical protein